MTEIEELGEQLTEGAKAEGIEVHIRRMFPDIDPHEVRLRTLSLMWKGKIRCFRTSVNDTAIRYVLAEEVDKFLKVYPKAIEFPAWMYEMMLHSGMMAFKGEDGKWHKSNEAAKEA